MQKNRVQFNEFTDSLAGMIEYSQKLNATNENDYKKIIKVLSKAIDGELTDRQKECIMLKYYKNLNITQIAYELGVGKSTVSRHVKKAKIRLHKILDYYLSS